MPYIYLIHCRASINCNEPVYKIGKTIDFSKRVDGYDKGSIPIFTLYVSECDEFEKYLITIFENKFIKRTDYGNEYFEGNISEMINIIITEFNDKKLEYNCNTQPNTKTIQQNTINIIKLKTQLLAKLNKVNKNNMNMFYNIMTSNGHEFMSSQYYHMLLNSIQQYNYDMNSGKKSQKFGDYLENNYAYVNNLCSSIGNNSNSVEIKLIERIKLAV